MRRSMVFSLLVTGAIVACAWPGTSQGAAAVKLGKSGYSGTLSSDPTVRSQQLLCDPDGEFNLLYGSASTSYDANTVTLTSVFGLNGYGVEAYVQAILAPVFTATAPPPSTPIMVQADQFFANRSQYTETGLLRVLFNSDGGQPLIADPNVNLAGREYGFLGHAGPEGTITHGLTFDYLGRDGEKVVTYTNFAGADDFLQYDGNGGRVTDIASASISGNLYAATAVTAVPLPSAAWAGLGLMGALAGARLVRSRRAAHAA